MAETPQGYIRIRRVMGESTQDFIRRVVQAAPPLRPEDLERIRVLLAAPPTEGDTAARDGRDLAEAS